MSRERSQVLARTVAFRRVDVHQRHTLAMHLIVEVEAVDGGVARLLG